MKDGSFAWLEKGSADYRTAKRELRVRKNPNFDAVCFHAQQCVEKLFKAILLRHGRQITRTHDLEFLLDQILDHNPLLEILRNDAVLLSQYAVQFRYPGETADKQEAQEAIQAMVRCANELRNILGDIPTS